MSSAASSASTVTSTIDVTTTAATTTALLGVLPTVASFSTPLGPFSTAPPTNIGVLGTMTGSSPGDLPPTSFFSGQVPYCHGMQFHSFGADAGLPDLNRFIMGDRYYSGAMPSLLYMMTMALGPPFSAPSPF
jgi:hypothetical protein